MVPGKAVGTRHTVTAQNVTDGSIVFPVDYAQAVGAIVVVRDAAGAEKAWDGVITVTSDLVTVDNAGATDWAATDTIDIVIY